MGLTLTGGGQARTGEKKRILGIFKKEGGRREAVVPHQFSLLGRRLVCQSDGRFIEIVSNNFDEKEPCIF